MCNIGEFKRMLVVEPLVLPTAQPEPEPEPERQPALVLVAESHGYVKSSIIELIKEAHPEVTVIEDIDAHPEKIKALIDAEKA